MDPDTSLDEWQFRSAKSEWSHHVTDQCPKAYDRASQLPARIFRIDSPNRRVGIAFLYQ